MITVEIDDTTAQTLEFAANYGSTTVAKVIERIVREWSLQKGGAAPATPVEGGVPIFVDYEGVRTEGVLMSGG